jgi:hypothetical protein
MSKQENGPGDEGVNWPHIVPVLHGVCNLT